MGDASGQEFSGPPIEDFKIPFGSIAVKEELNSDLLTPHEKQLYGAGMGTLEGLVEAAGDNVSKMVLTNPDMVSGIIGIQPLVSMKTGESTLLYRSFNKAGIDFNENYSFLEFGKERGYLKILVNDKAAENILRTYQSELGIDLSNETLQKEQIISSVTQLLNNPDVRKANLAHGLLSGFPPEDCKYWINKENAVVNPIPELKVMENLDNRFSKTINPISLLDADDYEMQSTKNSFLPDTRKSFNGRGKVVEGFGLRWLSSPQGNESTTRHIQKVLQIDRELGLLDFVNKQRAQFNVTDNTDLIRNASKDLGLGKPTSGFKSSFGTSALGFAVGIFLVLGSAVKNVVNPPPPPKILQQEEAPQTAK